tara:strand:+ start:1165 stop:1545 length:381 start_codon:yes stop_codon:yes gene_type:complete
MKTIKEIKKAYPLFFNERLMDNFAGKIYPDVLATDKGSYFISSEIFAYERISEHEIDYPEKNRVFKVRFADKLKGKGLEIGQINTVHDCLSYEAAKIYLEKLFFDNGGFRISQHDANMARLRIINK